MNSVTLLATLTSARADPWQEDVAVLSLGAQFAAMMPVLDTAMPLQNPKQPMATVPEVNGLVAQTGMVKAEGEAALPFLWQAIASDYARLPKISPDFNKGHRLAPDDAAGLDAAVADWVSAPALLPLDPVASADLDEEADVSSEQGDFAATQQPMPDMLGGLVLPQVEILAVLSDTAPPPPDELAQPTDQAATPQNLPSGPALSSAVFYDAANAIDPSRLHPIGQGHRGQDEHIAEKTSVQEGVQDAKDKPSAPDFESAPQVRRAQVSSAAEQGADPRREIPSSVVLQTAQDSTGAQVLATDPPNPGTTSGVQGLNVVSHSATQREDLSPKVVDWLAPEGEVAVKADALSAKPDKPDQAHLAAPIDDLQPAPRTLVAHSLHNTPPSPLPPAPSQALTDPRPSAVTAADPVLRLETKRSANVQLSAAAPMILQPAVQPADIRPAQLSLPLPPVQPASEGPPKGGANAADTFITLIAAPDTVLGTALWPKDGGMMATSSFLPPTPLAQQNPSPTLHANMPALVAHLHQRTPGEGHSQADVSMNPAELGRIRFEMITQGDQVLVTLSVERPETLDLLRTNAEALRQEFREVGLNADMLNFGEWAQRAPPRDQPPAPPDLVASAAPPLAIPTPYVKPVHASGLDLRL